MTDQTIRVTVGQRVDLPVSSGFVQLPDGTALSYGQSGYTFLQPGRHIIAGQAYLAGDDAAELVQDDDEAEQDDDSDAEDDDDSDEA